MTTIAVIMQENIPILWVQEDLKFEIIKFSCKFKFLCKLYI